jgi:hypothetical protein
MLECPACTLDVTFVPASESSIIQTVTEIISISVEVEAVAQALTTLLSQII